MRNITTDISGNLQKSIKISKYQKFNDEYNKYFNDIIYSFEDISNENKIDETIFKNNLNIILDLIKPIMKKEEYITFDILNDLTNKRPNK